MEGKTPKSRLFGPKRRARQAQGSMSAKSVLLCLLLATSTPLPGSAKDAKAPVYPKSPVFLEPIKNYTLSAGRTVRLDCVVDHLGSYKVAWIQKEQSIILTVGNHVINRNPRISVTHDGQRTWSLMIRDLQPRDAGTYMCQINTETVINQLGYLTVNVPPLIKDEMSSRDMRLVEGGDVTLACSARGSPVPTVHWRREDEQPIRVNGTKMMLQSDGPLLYLKNLKRTDMAAYLCIAANGVPPSRSKRISVEVEFQPLVYAPLQLVHAHFGQDMKMECFIEAFPPGLSYWKRPSGIEIVHSDNKYVVNTTTISEKGETYRSRTVLTVRNVQPTDVGEYVCISNNSQGGAEQAVRLSASRPVSSVKNALQKGGHQKEHASGKPSLLPSNRKDEISRKSGLETEVLPRGGTDSNSKSSLLQVPSSPNELEKSRTNFNQFPGVDTPKQTNRRKNIGYYPTYPDFTSGASAAFGSGRTSLFKPSEIVLQFLGLFLGSDQHQNLFIQRGDGDTKISATQFPEYAANSKSLLGKFSTWFQKAFGSFVLKCLLMVLVALRENVV